MSDFKLFPFQEDAADALRGAALNWMALASEEGPPKFVTTPIPFLGQLRAVTGAGKTPILTDVVAGLGPAVVLWTSRSSAVVEQTYNNLRGRYGVLLPHGAKVIRNIPGQAEWRAIVQAKKGLSIWVVTVASWNEADSAAGSGSAEARLNLHRPHPDWAGEKSPWSQLRDDLERPLWIVSDESHNQSTTQLDQLADLRPRGFFMASATPVANERFAKWQEAIEEGDPVWRDLARAGVVRVDTRDVVEAELLKTTIELVDYNSGMEESLSGALSTLKAVDRAASREAATVAPRAVYVVEKSNVPKTSPDDPPPVRIWRYLTENGVAQDAIAVYTDTRVLPEGAERVSSLSGLHDRHRHIIFNQSLQEGWDDPEAYVCYFDGVTKSYVRIKQIVGRILRQPRAQHFGGELLNTATIILNVPADSYEAVVTELKAELRLYAPEDEPDLPVIRVKTRREPLPAIPVKKKWAGKLSLRNLALKAPNMARAEKLIRARGSVWRQEDLDFPGKGRKTVVSLKEQAERDEFLDVVRAARTRNSLFLRRYVQNRNRACLNAINPDAFSGPGYAQSSCLGSTAQMALRDIGEKAIGVYESGVEHQDDPDPDRTTWIVGEHRPRGTTQMRLSRAAHRDYSTLDFNKDEREFAAALDATKRGVWVRNPSTPNLGYSIPLPAKVDDSSRFYPDFLWWPDGSTCWALDTTGRHLLNAKVRGKLIALDEPHVALVVRGEVDLAGGTITGTEGWSLVRARQYIAPKSEWFEDLLSLLRSVIQPS